MTVTYSKKYNLRWQFFIYEELMLLNCGAGKDSFFFWLCVSYGFAFMGRLLRVPWTARRLNQSILKEINPKYSLEGLKLQYFGHMMQRADSERLRAWGEGDNRGWDGWMASPTQWTWVWANSGSWWWTGRPGVLQSMRLPRVGNDLATEQQHAPF